MNYKEKVPRLIEKYLFDDRAELVKDQFSDLIWETVDSGQDPMFSVLENLMDKDKPKKVEKLNPPKGDKEYLAVWGGGLGTQGSLSIMTADEIHNFNHRSLYAFDMGHIYAFTEIPSKEYFFNKLYKDKYKDIKEATTDLLEKYNEYLKEQEAKNAAYNKKWDKVDHASFFAITKLAFPLKMELTFDDIPVVFEDSQVGTAALIEYDGNKAHFAIKLNPDFGHFDHKTIGKSYDVDYQIECKDDDDGTYIVGVKKVILIKL